MPVTRARRADWWAIGLGALVLISVILVAERRLPQLVAVEEAVFDQYQRWQPRPYDPAAPVRVIDVNEASLDALGQWPWPRTYLAELVERLTEAGAAAIAFDMVFAEPDRTSPSIMADTLGRFGDDYGGLFDQIRERGEELALPDHDAAFAEVLARAPVVLGVVPSDAEHGTPPVKRRLLLLTDAPPDRQPELTRFPGAIGNLSAFGEATPGIGAISLARDEGQVIRRVPVIQGIGGEMFALLSVEALRVAQDAGSVIVKTSSWQEQRDFSGSVAVSGMKVGAVTMPLDADGQLRVRYSGAEAERVIPAHRLLEPAGLPADVADEVMGRIVLVGSSAAALFDVKTTPLSPRIAGVHVHAEVIEQIVAQEFLTRPDWEKGLERLVIVLIGGAIIFLLGFNRPLSGFGLLLVGTAAISGGSWVAFSDHALLFSPVAALAGIALPHVTVSGYKYFTAEAGRREVTRQFEHFVAPEVIQDIVDDPEHHLTPGGAQRNLTIMFLDVRRFSTITEKMEPQEVISFINTLLTPLTDAILDHQGTIDKYMGDAVMAFWNAPRETEGHEEKAVRAMLAFDPIMTQLNEEFLARGLTDIDIGVGLNTGLCSVGNMGSVKRLAYSCVGDSVNLAARLEGQTKAYGVRNLIGSATAAGVPAFALIELDSVAVKGRSQPETVFTVAGDAETARLDEFQTLKDELTAARNAYLLQDWDAADTAFLCAAARGPVGAFDPGGYAGIMRDRIADYRAAPPPRDWDGVYVATSK